MNWHRFHHRLDDWIGKHIPNKRVAEPLHHWGVLVPTAAVAAAVLMVIHPEPVTDRTRIEHQMYFDQVSALVNDGLLNLDQLRHARRDIEAGVSPAPAAADDLTSLGVREKEIRGSARAHFYRASALRDDILAYLRAGVDQQKTFRHNGADRLVVDASKRRIPTAFAPPNLWDGRLLFVDRQATPSRQMNASLPQNARELRVALDGAECVCRRLRLFPVSAPPTVMDALQSLEGASAPQFALASRLRFTGRAQDGRPPVTLFDAFLTQESAAVRLNVIPSADSEVKPKVAAGWRREIYGAVTGYSILWPPPAGNANLSYNPSGLPGAKRRELTLSLLTGPEIVARPYTGNRSQTTHLLISHRHYLNGKPRRTQEIGEPTNAGTPHALAFLGPLDDCIDELLREAKKERAPITEAQLGQDFAITIDPSLQRTMEAALRSGDPSAYDATELAVTVMDERGDLLGIADRPLALLNARDQRNGPAEEPSESALQNKNFLDHPVGSAGKPILGTAAMVAHTELATLWVERQPRSSDLVLGYLTADKPRSADDQPPTYHHAEVFSTTPPDAEGVRRQIGYAFAKSSNTFFQSLILLAVALDGAQGQPQELQTIPQRSSTTFQVAGHTYRNSPVLSGLTAGVTPPTFAGGLANTRWATALHGLFGIPLSLADTEGTGERNIDEAFGDVVAFARELLPEQEGEAPRGVLRAHRLLLGIAPEHSRQLLFNSIALRDLFNMVLGGGDFGRWTNLDLARCFTRVITGRRVQTTLMLRQEADGSTPTRPPPAEIQELAVLRPQLREWLQKPVDSGGTANALGAKLFGLEKQRNRDLRLFAKTGTFPFNDAKPTDRDGSYSMVMFFLELDDGSASPPGLCCVMSINSNKNWIKSHPSAAANFAAQHLLQPLVDYLRARASLQASR